MDEIRCRISGKVQMVMFRDFVQRKARTLDITGKVFNLDDGSVEVIAQGEKEQLEKLIEHLHEGPLLAHVVRVEVEWRKPAQSFESFKIIF